MSKKRRKQRQNKQEIAQPESFWQNIPVKTQHIIMAVLLFIIPVIMFWDVVVGDQKFYAHDTIQWRAAAEATIEDREQYGYEPLWAPSMYGGMPSYFINYEKSAVNVDDVLNWVGRKAFPAGFMWIGLAGSYLLFVMMGANPLAAAFGALAFAFTTYIPIIIGAGHNSKFIAYNFIPWIIAGYYMLTRKQKLRWLGFGVFALALTAELRAGHPQVTYYFGIFMVIWWLTDLILAFKEKIQSAFLKKTGLLVLAAALSLVAVIQPYWPKTELTPYSTRGGSEIENTGGLDFDYAMAWSQGWGELLTLAIPNAYGGSSSDGTYWGPKSFTSGPHYMGALVFLFFIYGMVRWKNNLKWIFFGGGTLTMLFSLGNEFLAFNRLMYLYVPYFNKFRTPEMWLIVTVFAFTVIAVFGLQALFNDLKDKTQGLDSKEWAAIGAVLFFGGLMSVAPGSLLDFTKVGERQMILQQAAQQNQVSPQNPQLQQQVDQYLNNQIIPQRKEKAANDARRFLILTVIAGGMVIGVRYHKVAPAYAGIAVVLLTAYDLTGVGNRYISDNSKVPDHVDGERVLEQRERDVDTFIVENLKNETGVWDYRTFPLLDSPYNSAVPSYFYPTIGGYTAVKLAVFQDLIDETLDISRGQINTKVLSMLNTKYLTYGQPVQLPGFEVAFQGQSGVVMENTNVQPKAWFVDSLIVKTDAQEALSYLNHQDFDPAKHAVLQKDISTERSLTAGSAEVTTLAPRKIEIETVNEGDGFLVIGEVFYPAGWSATIDGELAEILKTNYVLRGIEVPAGNHTITLEFNPTSHTLGSTLAWIGNGLVFLIFVGGIFLTVKGNQFAKDEEETEEA